MNSITFNLLVKEFLSRIEDQYSKLVFVEYSFFDNFKFNEFRKDLILVKKKLFDLRFYYKSLYNKINCNSEFCNSNDFIKYKNNLNYQLDLIQDDIDYYFSCFNKKYNFFKEDCVVFNLDNIDNAINNTTLEQINSTTTNVLNKVFVFNKKELLCLFQNRF